MKETLKTIGRAAISSAVVGLPLYAAGAEGKELVVAFAVPFVGWLAMSFNVTTQIAMNMSPNKED